MQSALFTIREATLEDKPLIDMYMYSEGMDYLDSLENVKVAVNQDDQAVGVIRLAYDSKGVAHINPIVVNPQWRGYGVGKALVDDAFLDNREIRLVSRGTSKAFYDALGFEECAWDLIEKGVSEDCEGCSLIEECCPQPMRKVIRA